jgi:hypothetical protein
MSLFWTNARLDEPEIYGTKRLHWDLFLENIRYFHLIQIDIGKCVRSAKISIFILLRNVYRKRRTEHLIWNFFFQIERWNIYVYRKFPLNRSSFLTGMGSSGSQEPGFFTMEPESEPGLFPGSDFVRSVYVWEWCARWIVVWKKYHIESYYVSMYKSM